MATAYRNPIIPGFAPDPTVVHVDGIFYLSNSSFHMFPGLPIYASKNLKSWTQIGNAINRPEQLELEHSVCLRLADHSGRGITGSTGLLAPTLRHHKGVFYMICTNLAVTSAGFKPMNFYVTSTDIWSNVWSNPIYYEWNGIDPSLFFDDDDRVYIQGQAVIGDRSKQPTGHIRQCELDIRTGKLIGESKVIWGGWNLIDTEGPHVYKRNGWYYCLAAEGGTFEDHVLSIGRSRNIWGPYETAPENRNPVLTAVGTKEYVQNTGHGDFFQDAQGLWWAAVLGIRRETGGQYPLSRETFLTPVTWTEDEWPICGQPTINMERSESTVLQLPDLDLKSNPKNEFLYIRDRDSESYQFSKQYETATLKSSSATTMSAKTGTATFVGKRQRNFPSTSCATVVISKEPSGSKLESGLAVYKDNYRTVRIYYSYAREAIVLGYQQQDPEEIIEIGEAVETKDAAEVAFRIEASELKYVFSYKLMGGVWTVMGEVDSLEMTARDFTGPVIGIFAFGVDGHNQEFRGIAL